MKILIFEIMLKMSNFGLENTSDKFLKFDSNGVGNHVWQSDLGGDYRILFVNFLGLSGGGQQVQQFFEPQTFDEPPSVSTK